MGMTARHMASREWERPSVAEALETARLWTIKEFIQRSQATVADQVA